MDEALLALLEKKEFAYITIRGAVCGGRGSTVPPFISIIKI